MSTLQELMEIKGRAVLITGGAGYIGYQMALSLAELGASVGLMDIVADSAKARAEELSRKFGVKAYALPCDLADEEALLAAAERALEVLGGLDVLINCAGFGGDAKLPGWVVPFGQQSAASWRAALEVNLTAPFILTQAVAPALKASGHGSVINVGSIYGELGPDMRLYENTQMGNPAGYGASKGGLSALTRHLATVLAPEVRVNCLILGGVWREQPEEFVKRYQERTPMGRMAREEDFLGATIYLASDMSSYVTGTNLVIDGGFSAW